MGNQCSGADNGSPDKITSASDSKNDSTNSSTSTKNTKSATMDVRRPAAVFVGVQEDASLFASVQNLGLSVSYETPDSCLLRNQEQDLRILFVNTECINLRLINLIREAVSTNKSLAVFVEKKDLVARVEASKFGIFECNAKQRQALTLKALSAFNDAESKLLSTAIAGETVLVVGSGGREHAIALTLAKSQKVTKVFVAPGNGGTSGGKIQNISLKTNEDMVAFAVQNNISLVAVGPEQPLVDGLTDMMTKAGVACFGPYSAAARIEASKAWSKDFFARNDIPTARYKNFTSFEEAKRHLESIDYKVVVKASGLAAGKGVIIPENTAEAIEAARYIMVDGSFGKDAGAEVVIEEFLEGEELSLLAFCDGNIAIGMPGAQDHKRVFDGDMGPNTGGMGAYAPAPICTPELRKQCMDIIQRTVSAMASEGCPYKGVLYAGFMITKNGPSVLEYNCRMGDPETQVVLPLLESDLYEIMLACVESRLVPELVTFADKAACTVVAAAPGYPDSYPKGLPITGIDQANVLNNVQVFHAGTKLNNGVVETSGGRVLAVTGIGKSLKEAVDTAYNGIAKITFDGMQNRKDIAHKGLKAPLIIGVLGSTRGTALQATIDAINAGELNAKIALIVSNKKDAGILERAKTHNIPSVYISTLNKNRPSYDAEVTAAFMKAGVQCVLMVGYMRIVSAEFTTFWKGRCLNVHPSLLPDFAGGMDLQVHADVIAAGKKTSGCTVHLVTEEVDGGPIVIQETCDVLPEDTPETLKARVQAMEGPSFIKAINALRYDILGKPLPAAYGGSKDMLTYRGAGVDIDAGEALVQAIKPYCKATRRSGCDADLGGFGGLFNLAQAGYDSSETVLVSGTDGVGTKLKIAQAVGKHDTIGIDLVAMCVNDILVCGAEPLFFLDYYATGALQVHEASQVVKGIAEGCVQSGASLIGGETAEMAGMYAKGEYDLAGFCVGAVNRSELLPKSIGAGDVLIGLRSSGVHSNGYSLVRKCVERSGLSWDAQAPFQPASTLGDALLAPTRIYVKALMPLIKEGLLKGMAHITGGGLTDNVPRILHEGIRAEVDMKASGWTLPPVFKWLQGLANLPQDEMLRTFNCGVGMVVVVAAEHADNVMKRLQETETEAFPPLLLGSIQTKTPGQASVTVLGSLE